MLKPLKVRVASNEIKELQMVDVPKLPDLDGKTPKEMRRAWLRFMADHDLTGELYIKAEYVRLSIEELILNDGTPAEPVSQKNLEQRLANFEMLRSRDA